MADKPRLTLDELRLAMEATLELNMLLRVELEAFKTVLLENDLVTKDELSVARKKAKARIRNQLERIRQGNIQEPS
jgi:hypothetical protein